MKKKSFKKVFLKDKVFSIFCLVAYAVSILGIRFIDDIENLLNWMCKDARKASIASCVISMVIVVIVMIINYIMCVCGQTDKEKYDKISGFEITTNGKRETRGQRDTLLEILKTTKFPKKERNKLIVVEFVACIVFSIGFMRYAELTRLVTGLIIDAQTIIMAYLFYCNNHWRYRIETKLNLK